MVDLLDIGSRTQPSPMAGEFSVPFVKATGHQFPGCVSLGHSNRIDPNSLFPQLSGPYLDLCGAKNIKTTAVTVLILRQNPRTLQSIAKFIRSQVDTKINL